MNASSSSRRRYKLLEHLAPPREATFREVGPRRPIGEVQMSPSDRRDGIGGVGSPDLMAADTDNGVPPDDDPLARRCEERRRAKRVPYRPVAALRSPPPS